MRIWSQVLTASDFHECAEEVKREFPGCAVYVRCDDDPLRLVRGPNAGALRFDHVHLRSHVGRYYPNPGTGRALFWGGEMAASWTEWGWWLARLFERDPSARCGEYRGAADFHEQTNRRFMEPRTARERQLLRRGIQPERVTRKAGHVPA